MIDCAKAKNLFSISRSSSKDMVLAQYASKSFYGPLFSNEEKVNKVKAVTYADVNKVAKDILTREKARIEMVPQH
jgi:predicted Zn-dependent peptidase